MQVAQKVARATSQTCKTSGDNPTNQLPIIRYTVGTEEKINCTYTFLELAKCFGEKCLCCKLHDRLHCVLGLLSTILVMPNLQKQGGSGRGAVCFCKPYDPGYFSTEKKTS